jgi:hypothetical protein
MAVPLIKGPIHIIEIVPHHLAGLTMSGRITAIIIDIVATSAAIVERTTYLLKMILSADLGLGIKAVSINTTIRDIRTMKYFDQLGTVVMSLIAANNRVHLINFFVLETDPVIVVTA